jgi:hypothetical protein
MSTISTRVRVRADGSVLLPNDIAKPGDEVNITVTPDLREFSNAEWADFVNRTAGSIPDESFARPPQDVFPLRDGVE